MNSCAAAAVVGPRAYNPQGRKLKLAGTLGVKVSCDFENTKPTFKIFYPPLNLWEPFLIHNHKPNRRLSSRAG